MAVRAKFRITKIERMISSVPDPANLGKWKDGVVVSIHAAPVYGNGDPNHENTKFWQSSPSGSIVLGTVNEAAAEQFVLGGEVYVDFTPAG